MTKILDTLARIHRPRLLVRAARHGLDDYNRSRDLKRILRGDAVPTPSTALDRLVDLEAAQEKTRCSGDASYSIAVHLEILIALMAEAQILTASRAAS